MSEPLAPPAPMSPPTSPLADPNTVPVRPPQTLLFDCAVSLVVVAVCAWQRQRFLDLSDSWLLALSLLFPLGNLLGLGLGLGAYKLRPAALHYRMALAALFTLYYGYVALHLAGLHESPLGALLQSAAGDTTPIKVETGLAVALLLLQTFIATDACQRTLNALPPPLAAPPSARQRASQAVTIIPA